MRYLNKIVFINSAKTALAEIELAGNVHFIGTQGVGKSTLLRAILFFYNADKTKLGIDLGQTGFDAYYFPADNSYIIYEVAHEHQPFCVLALRSQGRAAFRFISGAYDRSHFIDAQNRAMTWENIRKTLDRKGTFNRKVEKYEEYRDILYGNNSHLPPEVRKYALLESKQYQNIPRTIQNVFLNAKLDAEFIKQTIIRSLNEDDFKLSLTTYAAHLHTFEANLKDLQEWADKREGTGGIPSPKLAQTIVEKALEWRLAGADRKALLAQIKATYFRIQKELPQLENALQEQQQKKAEAYQKREADEQYFSARRKIIDREIHEADYKLGEIKKKAAFYQSKAIDEVIARAAEATFLLPEKSRLETEKALLLQKFQDVNEKYEAQIAQVEGSLAGFGLALEKQKLEIQNDLLQAEKSIQEGHRQATEQSQIAFAARLDSVREAEAHYRQELADVRLRRREVELSPPFAAELLALKNQLNAFQTEKAALQNGVTATEHQTQHLRQQWEGARLNAERDFERVQKDHLDRFRKTEADLSAVEEKIAQLDASFYTWLSQNQPGWEHTIGKVIDEQDVLFRADLSPRISGKNPTDFYGVSVDLSALSKTVKTPADYEAERHRLQTLKTTLEAEATRLQDQFAERQESLKKKFAPQLSSQKERHKQQTYRLEQIEIRQQKEVVELESMERKAAAEKVRLLSEVSTLKDAVEKAIGDASGNLKTIREEQQQALTALTRETAKRLTAAKTKSESEVAVIEDHFRKHQAGATARIADIRKEQSGALQDAGAEEKRIVLLDTRLETISQKLKQIALEATLLSDYQKDKREWLDNETSYRADKKASEQKLLAETNRIAQRREVQNKAIGEISTQIQTLEKTIADHNADLKAARDFEVDEDGFDLLEMLVRETPISGKRLTELCPEAWKLRANSSRLLDELKKVSTEFSGRFSPENLFGFPTTFADEEAYLRFADNLKAFLEESKIEAFEKQVNARYAEVIRLIGKEVSGLISKEGEIQNVITKINKDFRERAFAGVIKSIELRLSASRNQLVQLLIEIARFNKENNLALGTTDLFSVTDSDVSNKKAVQLLRSFARQIEAYKMGEITLSDSFELEFRIVENDNDSQWVERLSKVGSEGTDVLVKAMINIMLLNVFKESASRNRFRDFRLHCMMDEIGKLHPSNVKGILTFANDRNILLINSSPTSYNATDYRYTYLLSKDAAHKTVVRRLVSQTAAE